MKLYYFDAQVATPRTDFGSRHFSVARIVQTVSGLNIVCIHLSHDGVLARHQTASNQLFMVTHGEGEVSGNDDDRITIRSGIAAFWEAGEWHETRTQNGLTAIVLEGDDLNPTEFMIEV